ncbi:MAG TPA: Rieske 2Fe-2S domain-containing protein [Planctomicrobium sp.]|nr:Rieske 2Fe-2S domain-containing protein [Planctomicrobium sp.]
MGLESALYIPGKFYRVPCVEAMWKHRVGIYVVIGPKHDDAEIIRFPEQHWHMHAKFAPDWAMTGIHRSGVHDVFSMPIHTHSETRYEEEFEARFIGYRVRKCRREMPVNPFPGRAGWHKELTNHYAEKSLNLKRPVCPHRGVDLSCVPVRNGCITCPLHGLMFDTQTGRVRQPG